MAKNIKLQHSESVVAHAASRIYSAYIVSGKVNDDNQDQWMRKSIKAAIKICVATDDAVISDDEIKAMGL